MDRFLNVAQKLRLEGLIGSEQNVQQDKTQANYEVNSRSNSIKEDPETFQSYIPEPNIKRRFAQTALVAKSDTDPELALKQINETNVVKNNDETLETL